MQRLLAGNGISSSNCLAFSSSINLPLHPSLHLSHPPPYPRPITVIVIVTIPLSCKSHPAHLSLLLLLRNQLQSHLICLYHATMILFHLCQTRHLRSTFHPLLNPCSATCPPVCTTRKPIRATCGAPKFVTTTFALSTAPNCGGDR